MTSPREDEILGVLERVSTGLERLGIRYFVTGSFASGVHGVYRQTADLDLVADFDETDVSGIVSEFSEDFYVAEAAVRRSLASGTAFNLIHLETSFKVDVFLLKERGLEDLLDRALEQSGS